MGKFQRTDERGFLINETALSLIEPPWKDLTDTVVAEHVSQFGGHLVAVYVRGSVAKGLAIPFVSDIDCIALVRGYPPEIHDEEWWERTREDLCARFPFAVGVELPVHSIELLWQRSNDPLRFALKTQACCIFGEDIDVAIPAYKVGADIAYNLINVTSRLRKVEERLQRAPTDVRRQWLCAATAKLGLRAGFESEMVRVGRYTRDVDICCSVLSERYPEKRLALEAWVDLVINPSADARRVSALIAEVHEFISTVT